MSKFVVIVYKEPGKEPEFRKIPNDVDYFKSLIGGDIKIINYDSYCIVMNENQNTLKANIYLNTSQLGFDKTIKGIIFAINRDKETEKFSTLNKEQAFKCRKLFIDEAFDYTNFDENGKYIGYKKRKNKNKKQFPQPYPFQPQQLPPVIKNGMQIGDPVIDQLVRIPGVELVKMEDDEKDTSKTNENSKLEIKNNETINFKNQESDNNYDDFDRNSTLRLILEMQSVIIKLIKENSD